MEPHFAREGREARRERESVVKHNCLFDGWEWEWEGWSFEWLGAETVLGFGA